MQTFKIEKNDTQCVVTLRYFYYTDIIGFVLLVCLLYPGVAVLYHLVVVQRDDVIFAALFVWGIWLIFFVLFLHSLFGKTRLVLARDGLETMWTFLFIKQEKWYELADICRFEAISYQRWKGGITYTVRVVLQENDVSFNTFASGSEVADLCEHLNAFLETLKAASSVDAP